MTLRAEDVPIYILVFAVLTLVVHFVFEIFFPKNKK